MKSTFTNDPIMSDLHAIFLSSYGYRLVPTKRGTRKLVRSSK